MKKIILGYVMFNMILSISCNSGQSQQMKPEKVYRIVYEAQPNEWYQKQSELWKAEIDKNPNNPEAWYNYYNANRYSNFEDLDKQSKKEKLQKIIEDMGKAIPETYEYYLLKYWNSWNIEDLDLVERAYKINPQRPDTYYPFISKAKIEGNTELLKEFCDKLYKSKDVAPWLINYNYNVLMSLEKNAILITNGDNDTYPIWMLQNAKNIRQDITVINASMSVIEKYLINSLNEKNIRVDYIKLKELAKEEKDKRYPAFSAKFIQELVREISKNYPDIPVYFALTVYKPYCKPFKENLYVTGLANKYSTTGIDNFALLKKNIEENFRLDYLDFEWYSEDFPGKTIMRVLHTNYVVPFILLAEHHKTSGQIEKALKLKNMALLIAEKNNNEKLMQYIIDKDI
jgi:hypothetical protein